MKYLYAFISMSITNFLLWTMGFDFDPQHIERGSETFAVIAINVCGGMVGYTLGSIKELDR